MSYKELFRENNEQYTERIALVMERIKRQFYKRYSRSNVILSYRVSNLDKLDEIAEGIWSEKIIEKVGRLLQIREELRVQPVFFQM